MAAPNPNPSDEKEVIKGIIGQIRDLYVDIIKLRNDDRNKYKEMCNRLDALEKDRSTRTKKRRLLANKKKRAASKNSKNPGPSGASKASKEDNKKASLGADTPKSTKNEEDGDKE